MIPSRAILKTPDLSEKLPPREAKISGVADLTVAVNIMPSTVKIPIPSMLFHLLF
jgi:hypothetical protein